MEQGVKAIDIAADFRIRDASAFQSAYKVEHPAPHLLSDAVYGLPEIHRENIKSAKLTANPGCYPEASILALLPAVREGIIVDDVIIDAKSGISGAGRGGLATNIMDHYAEANENVVAYGLDGHGHQPEIVQELAGLREAESARVTFIPHRIPMTRGILATCYAPLVDGISKEQVRRVYQESYRSEPFVRVTDMPPQTKQTLGSNYCLIYPTIDEKARRLGRSELPGQLGEGRCGPGRPEHEPNVRPAGDHRTGEPVSLSLMGLSCYSFTFVSTTPPWCSGLARHPFKVEIRGSNPLGGTKIDLFSLAASTGAIVMCTVLSAQVIRSFPLASAVSR